jgi:hypothetical protein
LKHENKGLKEALNVKKKHQKKSKTLDLQQHQEHHGGAVFWSPRAFRKAKACDQVKRCEAAAVELKKANTKQLKAAATLYNKNCEGEACGAGGSQGGKRSGEG